MDLVFYYNLNYDIFDINAGLKKYKIMASSLFIEKMITKFQSHQILMFKRCLHRLFQQAFSQSDAIWTGIILQKSLPPRIEKILLKS